MASLVVLAPLDLARRDDARLILLPTAAVLAVGLVAFILLDPLRAAIGTTDSFLLSLAESVLVILYVGGLEGVAVNLLPVTYMDGAKVMRWSRLAWALSFSAVMFLWWQPAVQPEPGVRRCLQAVQRAGGGRDARLLHGHDGRRMDLLPSARRARGAGGGRRGRRIGRRPGARNPAAPACSANCARRRARRPGVPDLVRTSVRIWAIGLQ